MNQALIQSDIPFNTNQTSSDSTLENKSIPDNIRESFQNSITRILQINTQETDLFQLLKDFDFDLDYDTQDSGANTSENKTKILTRFSFTPKWKEKLKNILFYLHLKKQIKELKEKSFQFERLKKFIHKYNVTHKVAINLSDDYEKIASHIEKVLKNDTRNTTELLNIRQRFWKSQIKYNIFKKQKQELAELLQKLENSWFKNNFQKDILPNVKSKFPELYETTLKKVDNINLDIQLINTEENSTYFQELKEKTLLEQECKENEKKKNAPSFMQKHKKAILISGFLSAVLWTWYAVKNSTKSYESQDTLSADINYNSHNKIFEKAIKSFATKIMNNSDSLAAAKWRIWMKLWNYLAAIDQKENWTYNYKYSYK